MTTRRKRRLRKNVKKVIKEVLYCVGFLIGVYMMFSYLTMNAYFEFSLIAIMFYCFIVNKGE